MHAIKQQQDEGKAQQQQQPQQQKKVVAGSNQASGSGLSRLVTAAQQRWEVLDNQQRAATVALGVLSLVVLPPALKLIVLSAERVLIASLLATEELLVQVILKAGVVAAAVAVVGVAAYAIWTFSFAGKGQK